VRLLLIKRGCPFCLEWTKVINQVNLKLPFEKRIRIIDNYEWEELGVDFNPIVNKFDLKTFHTYPFCYLDGIVVGSATKKLAHSFLDRYLREEFILK
jgi:hypothetical protein